MFNVETKTSNDEVKLNKAQKVVNIVAVVVCVLLIPILIFNCVLIVQGIINPDKVPSFFGKIPLIVLTDSMSPEINKGDLIFCEEVDTADLKVGDVISFFDPDSSGKSVVTHRIVSIIIDDVTGDVSYRTKGDYNNIEDRLSVPAENVVGLWTGVHIWQLGQVLLFTSQYSYVVIIPIILVVAALIILEMKKKEKQNQEKQGDIDALRAELEAMKAAQAKENEQPATESTEEKPTEPVGAEESAAPTDPELSESKSEE